MPRQQSGLTPDMLVQLETDSSVSGEGFRAEFTCIEPGSLPPPPPEACISPGLAYFDSGDIDKSGGYGRRHDCRWMLSCTDRLLAPVVTFELFDLEAGASILH
jgi:hypothetical protein